VAGTPLRYEPATPTTDSVKFTRRESGTKKPRVGRSNDTSSAIPKVALLYGVTEEVYDVVFGGIEPCFASYNIDSGKR
jgi:hypothetical protein